MTPPRRNVEIKARDADPVGTLERAKALGASDEGVLVQRDTYFGGARGRLKLREEPEGATLIAYARPDQSETRASVYRLAAISDPADRRIARTLLRREHERLADRPVLPYQLEHDLTAVLGAITLP